MSYTNNLSIEQRHTQFSTKSLEINRTPIGLGRSMLRFIFQEAFVEEKVNDHE